ncbi:MAG TPA: hypothetical protein DDZ67_09720 [Xanthomonadaceae bacterium]|nr:hypothetical protein [Xanthomonadaceae bacterium]
MKIHENKVAIVTGGTQDIGRGIADLLAQKGARVVIGNRGNADEAANAIGDGAIAADVTSEEGW